jgi:antagonist of KipI
VLLPDHATVGGYPVIATVITADLGRLGQLRSGDVVHFEQVSSATARTARIEQEREMTHRVKGWFPTESGT